MILLALAFVQATPSPPAAVDDDIVVIGHRLQTWRGEVATTLGFTTCSTKMSTGDKDIDAIGCEALKACWGPTHVRYEAANSRKLAADDRKLRTDAVLAELKACVVEKRAPLIDALHDRRAATRKPAA